MTPFAAAGTDGAVAALTTEPLVLGRRSLTLEDLVGVARHRRRVGLADDIGHRIGASAAWVAEAVGSIESSEQPVPIYGINTGFGSLAGRRVFESAAAATELSRRLILSNASGLGAPLPEEVVRAAMLVRAASLIQGRSGVRLDVVEMLVAALNADLYPVVPEFGSLGASGDLIPLAHLALVLSRPAGEDDPELDSGQAFVDGTIRTGKAAMAHAGLQRLVLGPKEGLALTNGTSFSTALCALALADAERLVRTAELGVAMTMEGLLGFRDAFLAPVHEARGHPGQVATAAAVLGFLEDSELVDGAIDRDPTRQPPQDAYALRCAPQVLGAVRDTLGFVRAIVERELNAATDNPLIFTDLPASRALKAVSGGNFHAEYLAFASDFLTIAVAEIASLAERRIFRLTDGTLNRGLPDMLIASGQVGLDCGYMLPQYLAAALVSDSRTLAHPDSVDSVPTCANQEDHVSMAMNAGRHARLVVTNAQRVVAIEILLAAQAIELRCREPGRRLEDVGRAGRAVLRAIRTTHATDGRLISLLEQDTVLYPRLDAMVDLVASGRLLEAADEA
jgi:histidine ammonia-lyase